MVEFRVSGADDLRRLSRQLRTVGNGKAIRRDLTGGLRAGTRPAVVAAKAAALSLPDAPGGDSTGLRRRMASATGAQVRTTGRMAGVRVRISRARMGEQASLARVTNTGRWRHPVYGNREVWVTQTSQRNWFDTANRLAAPGVRRAVRQVLDDIERRLARR